MIGEYYPASIQSINWNIESKKTLSQSVMNFIGYKPNDINTQYVEGIVLNNDRCNNQVTENGRYEFKGYAEGSTLYTNYLITGKPRIN